MTKMRAVSAVFGNGNAQRYSYFVPVGDEPKVGDLIVTSTSWGDPEEEDLKLRGQSIGQLADGARLARVVEVLDKPPAKATKFYLWLIPTAVLQHRQQENRNLIEREKARAAARAALDALLAEEGKKELWKRLAEVNPKAKELMEIIGDD